MRVVLDSNILVRAALRPQGSAAALLSLLTAGPHQVLLSEPILTEVGEVLSYDRIRRRLHLADEEIREFTDALRAIATIVILNTPIPALCRDPDDDLILATAVRGAANVLCTLDLDLHTPLVLAYLDTYSTRVLTDANLLTELRSAPSDSHQQ